MGKQYPPSDMGFRGKIPANIDKAKVLSKKVFHVKLSLNKAVLKVF